MNLDINQFIVDNQYIIDGVASRYRSNTDYDEFRQELMIEVWHHMEKYDPLISDSPKAYFLCYIDILAKRVLIRVLGDKNKKFNASFAEATEFEFEASVEDFDEWEKRGRVDWYRYFKMKYSEHLNGIHDVIQIDLDHFIETQLTEVEKRIVYSLDYVHESNNNYAYIAKKMGISARVLYYHIKNIRQKLKKAFNCK